MAEREFALAREIGEMHRTMLDAAGINREMLEAAAITRQLTSAALPFRELAAINSKHVAEMQAGAASSLSAFRDMQAGAASSLSAFRDMQGAVADLSAFRELQGAVADLSAFRELQATLSERITADDFEALGQRAFYRLPEGSEGEVPKIDAETVEAVSEGILKELKDENTSVAEALGRLIQQNVFNSRVVWNIVQGIIGNFLYAVLACMALRAWDGIKADIGEAKDCSPQKAQKIIKKYKVSVEEIEEYRFVRRPNARVKASRRRGSGEAVVLIEKWGRWSEIEYSDGEVEIQGWIKSKYLVRPWSDSPRRPLFTHSD
ncbi:MAG TPA: hypothetical protein VG125_14730 [Pirellulales bacterium]|jgi:hypothetical protein|nr:hypothetical protein [Pirellulales bacterium]